MASEFWLYFFEWGDFMATIIICVVLFLIIIYSIREYIGSVLHGCCGSGGDKIKKIKPKDDNVSNYSFAYEIDIEGMSCNNCKKTVENAFNEKSGFYAKVSLKDKNAIVRTKQQVSEHELKTIVQKEGYKAVDVKPID